MDAEEICILEFIQQRRYMYDPKDILRNSERRQDTYISLASDFNKKFNKNVTGRFYVHLFTSNK